MPSVTVDEVKDFLPVDYSTQDGTIAKLIAGVDDFLERILGRKLAESATYTDDVDGGGFALWPPKRPIVSITTITSRSTGDVEDVDNYVLSEDRVHRIDGTDWADYYPGCWRIAYVGGEEAPAGLKMAALQLISRLYDNRGGKVTQGAAGYGITWDNLIDGSIWTLLAPYGRGAVGVG